MVLESPPAHGKEDIYAELVKNFSTGKTFSNLRAMEWIKKEDDDIFNYLKPLLYKNMNIIKIKHK